MRGSWADDFETFIQANSNTLSEGTVANLYWEDVEQETTWNHIKKASYSMVIAHYLLGFLDNQEKLISRAAEVLAEGGMFSVNYYGLTKEHLYWRRVFEKMGLEISFAENAYAKAKKNHDDFEKLLHQYFKKVDYVTLPSPMCYETVDELFARALKRYPEAANALRAMVYHTKPSDS